MFKCKFTYDYVNDKKKKVAEQIWYMDEHIQLVLFYV